MVDRLPILRISIHAPTRGATEKPGTVRTHERFQSTLPRGERPGQCYNTMRLRNFNPRSHEGSDSIPAFFKRVFSVFQSTLPRGERHGLFISMLFARDFNPRSHEGSDKGLNELGCNGPVFQSTLPRGERQVVTANINKFLD